MQSKFTPFLWIYKIDSFALFTANPWRKNGVELIEYGSKIWINQGHLQEKLDLSNISDRTQDYSDELKKNRCETQERGNYQPCRLFIQNILAVQLTMTANKTQAAIFKAKFGVNQLDLVLCRQQWVGVSIKILFPKKDIKEEYFFLNWFYH